MLLNGEVKWWSRYKQTTNLNLRSTCIDANKVVDGFLESISSTFYAQLFCQYFGGKKIAKPNIIREKLLNYLSYEKRACKMLMKLTP